jgi:hypothetical protein
VSTIYIPTYVSYDGYHRIEDLTDDYGYFTSREDAEAWVKRVNDNPKGYEQYVSARQIEQTQHDLAYNHALTKWNRLVEAFGSPNEFMKEPQHRKVKVASFEEWTERQEATMGYVAVDLHEED